MEKLKGAQLRVRLAKISSNLYPGKKPNNYSLYKKAKSEGKWIAIIRAFIVKAKTLGSIGVKIYFLLNHVPTPIITLKRVRYA